MVSQRPEHTGCTAVIGNGHTKHPLSSHSMDMLQTARPVLSFLLAYKEDTMERMAGARTSSRTTLVPSIPTMEPQENQLSFSKHRKLERDVHTLGSINQHVMRAEATETSPGP